MAITARPQLARVELRVQRDARTGGTQSTHQGQQRLRVLGLGLGLGLGLALGFGSGSGSGQG